MIWGLLVAALLLAANAVFVGAEFAFVASRRSRIDRVAAEGVRRAVAARRSIDELSFMLSTAQLGITIASLLLGYVAEPAVAHLVEGPLESVLPKAGAASVAVVLALALVVFLHLVLGEMVPKSIAIAEPERSAMWLAVPVRAFANLLRPVVVLLNAAANGGLRVLGVPPAAALSEARSGDEIADLLAVSRREGILEEVEHRLMAGALRFPTRQVSHVMVPTDRIVAVAAGTSVAELERVTLESSRSRIVVFGEDIDEVLGFVHAKDLLGLPPAARSRPLPPRLVRRMLVVDGRATLQRVLLLMRRARVHLAVVVDEAGHTVGMVTLEDILEALIDGDQ